MKTTARRTAAVALVAVTVLGLGAGGMLAKNTQDKEAKATQINLVICKPAKECKGTEKSDLMEGGPGVNNFLGLKGNDIILGYLGGADVFSGGDGNDRIYADDGEGDDEIDCGKGLDAAYVDKGDKVSNCETVGEG